VRVCVLISYIDFQRQSKLTYRALNPIKHILQYLAELTGGSGSAHWHNLDIPEDNDTDDCIYDFAKERRFSCENEPEVDDDDADARASHPGYCSMRAVPLTSSQKANDSYDHESSVTLKVNDKILCNDLYRLAPSTPSTQSQFLVENNENICKVDSAILGKQKQEDDCSEMDQVITACQTDLMSNVDFEHLMMF